MFAQARAELRASGLRVTALQAVELTAVGGHATGDASWAREAYQSALESGRERREYPYSALFSAGSRKRAVDALGPNPLFGQLRKAVSEYGLPFGEMETIDVRTTGTGRLLIWDSDDVRSQSYAYWRRLESFGGALDDCVCGLPDDDRRLAGGVGQWDSVAGDGLREPRVSLSAYSYLWLYSPSDWYVKSEVLGPCPDVEQLRAEQGFDLDWVSKLRSPEELLSPGELCLMREMLGRAEGSPKSGVGFRPLFTLDDPDLVRGFELPSGYCYLRMFKVGHWREAVSTYGAWPLVKSLLASPGLIGFSELMNLRLLETGEAAYHLDFGSGEQHGRLMLVCGDDSAVVDEPGARVGGFSGFRTSRRGPVRSKMAEETGSELEDGEVARTYMERVVSTQGRSVPDGCVMMCFHQVDKKALKKRYASCGSRFTVVTVHESLGNAYGHVWLHWFEAPKRVDEFGSYDETPYGVLAVLRHTRGFLYEVPAAVEDGITKALERKLRVGEARAAVDESSSSVH